MSQPYDPQQPAPYGYGQPQPQWGYPQDYYPPQQFVQPPVHLNVQQSVYGPRGAVTVAGMSQGWKVFHAVMIVCTCGFWLPVYWAHNSSAKRRSVTTFR